MEVLLFCSIEKKKDQIWWKPGHSHGGTSTIITSQVAGWIISADGPASWQCWEASLVSRSSRGGVPQIIQSSMTFVLKPMVTWGFPHLQKGQPLKLTWCSRLSWCRSTSNAVSSWRSPAYSREPNPNYLCFTSAVSSDLLQWNSTTDPFAILSPSSFGWRICMDLQSMEPIFVLESSEKVSYHLVPKVPKSQYVAWPQTASESCAACISSLAAVGASKTWRGLGPWNSSSPSNCSKSQATFCHRGNLWQHIVCMCNVCV